MTMTRRERFIAAMKGEKMDKVPIWLREGFELPVGIPDEKDFMDGWKADPIYMDLMEYVKPHCSFTPQWRGYGFNRLLMVPEKYIEYKEYMLTNDIKRIEGNIQTSRKNLKFIDEYRRGYHTTWHAKEAAESIEDLVALLEIPFEIEKDRVKQCIESNYMKAYAQDRDCSIPNISISSPIVIISGSMPFDAFLEMTITEKKLMHDILEEVTRRNLMLIDEYFKDNKLETIVTLGGSEQCTPPMMSPHSFDEYVVPYDSQIVRRLKEYGIIVQCHCHGKVRHALKGMIEIGYDATDPIEPPPAGDITYEEACKLANGKITLLGNLEWDELEHSEPQHIRRRVKELLSIQSDRLILSSSAGPISKITQKLADNYKAWIDAALEFQK